jgi:hypothetical protein
VDQVYTFALDMNYNVEVGKCRGALDGSSFADFTYDVHVQFDDVKYLLERSYLDFCDLDAHIRAEIPYNVDIPDCPLIGASVIRKQRMKSSDPFGALRRATIGGVDLTPAEKEYSPHFAEDRTCYFRNAFEAEEDIESKTPQLAAWFNHIANEPAVLQLNTMAKFLNKEEKCFRKNSEGIDRELTEYDYLVPKKSIKAKQLMSKFGFPVEVQVGDILVWRFRSKSNDVAYGIDIGGEPVLGLRRYASSKEEVLGVMQVPDVVGGRALSGRAVCEMKFENKYAGVSATLYYYQ